MASKLIAAALKCAVKHTELVTTGQELLFDKRPYLREFMSSLEGGDGKGRECSALMVKLCDMGVRVGLSEPSIDSWVWREASDLPKALDAIEKALSSGGNVWTAKGGGRGRRGR